MWSDSILNVRISNGNRKNPLDNKALYAAHFEVCYRSPYSENIIPGIRPFHSYSKTLQNMNIAFKFHSNQTQLDVTSEYQITSEDEFKGKDQGKIEFPWRLCKEGKMDAYFKDENTEKNWIESYPTLTEERRANYDNKKKKKKENDKELKKNIDRGRTMY
jgi:hypothetical protein